MLNKGHIIISWDPGGTTGLAIIQYTGGTSFDVLRIAEVSWGSRFETTKAVLLAYSAIRHNLTIVVETFRLREDKKEDLVGSDFPSCQVIGIIQAWCYDFGILDNIVYQEPGIKSRTGILERHYDLVKGSEHKKDAYQHARYYIVHEASKSR